MSCSAGIERSGISVGVQCGEGSVSSFSSAVCFALHVEQYFLRWKEGGMGRGGIQNTTK